MKSPAANNEQEENMPQFTDYYSRKEE